MPFLNRYFHIIYFFKRDEIKRYIQLFPKILSNSNRDNTRVVQKTVNDIREILQPQFRRYLKVFNLEENDRLTNTVFQAVFDSINEEDRRSSKFWKENHQT